MDEDSVDVVEAIDAWIDEEIDDLTDDELESILEILDALSTSDPAASTPMTSTTTTSTRWWIM